ASAAVPDTRHTKSMARGPLTRSLPLATSPARGEVTLQHANFPLSPCGRGKARSAGVRGPLNIETWFNITKQRLPAGRGRARLARLHVPLRRPSGGLSVDAGRPEMVQSKINEWRACHPRGETPWTYM